MMSRSAKTALLVIDVQMGLFDKSHPVYQADQLLDNILALVEKAHAAGAPVFYVQHCDQRDLSRDSQGWQLHPRLQPLTEDFFLYKEKSNSFEGTDLNARLKTLGIEALVITGLVTHGCVKNGCMGAKEHGYQVTLAQDAHSNFSPKAAEVIEEWNHKLAAEGVILKPASDITFT
jgi:nicotinamidase-related amidase